MIVVMILAIAFMDVSHHILVQNVMIKCVTFPYVTDVV